MFANLWARFLVTLIRFLVARKSLCGCFAQNFGCEGRGIRGKTTKDAFEKLSSRKKHNLFAKTKKGNRPSYTNAARHEIAVPLYEQFLEKARHVMGKPVKHGIFGADMQIELTNDGPVTISIDSKNKNL